ncbi:MAG TPA: hypothetical protein VMU81_17510 [Acetobacteraceae bacterium]|nr:hypothetical protein [Acetobacteraceae bacterium]
MVDAVCRNIKPSGPSPLLVLRYRVNHSMDSFVLSLPAQEFLRQIRGWQGAPPGCHVQRRCLLGHSLREGIQLLLQRRWIAGKCTKLVDVDCQVSACGAILLHGTRPVGHQGVTDIASHFADIISYLQ